MPETAQDKLKKMVAADVAPTLTDDEVDELLASAGLSDTAGLSHGDEAWSPTYDLNAAAAKAWLIKAARAAAMIDEPTSGEVTAKVFDNCRAMARIYSARRSSTISIAKD